MKVLIVAFVSSIFMVGCRSTNNDEFSMSLSENSEFISHRELHEKEFGNLNFSTEQQWDSLNNIHQEQVLHRKGNVHPNIHTFGWHIYSNGSSWKNYNFSMLWGISYFSYAIQPETGGYKSVYQWKTTALIDSAKAHDCKIFLSVSNFGSDNNSVFLTNQKAQEILADSLSSLLALRSADGINIDFEGVSKKNEASFTRFIIALSKRLKQENPRYLVSLCLYAKDWDDIFDIESIDPYVDFYTLMGYDYYGSFSKTTGPVTPFTSSEKFGNGLEASVDHYSDRGVHLDKLIVGLPYYGVEWYTNSSEIGTAITKFKSHPPYKSIKKIYIDSLSIPVQFDSVSSSTYLILDDNDSSYRQIFFEDQRSLSFKYDWIKNKRIGGVGIWALGYDDGYSMLWDLLFEKFSTEQTATSNTRE